MSVNRTTATLRESLFDAMESVKNGSMEVKQAKAIADLADKIIETTDLELRYSQVVSKLDQADMGISTGAIMLTNEESK